MLRPAPLAPLLPLLPGGAALDEGSDGSGRPRAGAGGLALLLLLATAGSLWVAMAAPASVSLYAHSLAETHLAPSSLTVPHAAVPPSRVAVGRSAAAHLQHRSGFCGPDGCRGSPTLADPADTESRAVLIVASAAAMGVVVYLMRQQQLESRMEEWRMASVAAVPAPAGPEAGKTGVLGLLHWAFPNCNFKKLIPLACMSFLSLFNYTILRNTKDVMLVTAPQSGAEVIPFIKTYVNLPIAVLWTVLYTKLSNHLPQQAVFYGVVTGFLGFFAFFTLGLYPMRALLHPTAAADALQALLPASFMAPIALFRHWTFSLFYVVAEMWGSVVVASLYWGLVNQICTVEEAKVYYPMLGFIGNIAPIFGGQYGRLVSKMQEQSGMEGWGLTLHWLMGGVVVSGLLLMAVYTFVQRRVVTDPTCVDATKRRQAKQKTKLSIQESASFLARNRYILSIAMLVICYGTSMNIVEVTWKAKLRAQFPDPSSYSAFMGNFSTATGITTVLLMALSSGIFKRFGWGVAAAITPLTIGVTGLVFFSLILAPAFWAPITASLGTTPLMLAVMVGAVQNFVSKSSRFALFDPCKEMAYIPLDMESRIKGKAAIDVIGNPLGKSGGAILQQVLILGLGSLTAATPWLGACLCAIVWVWLGAARSLHRQFDAAVRASEAEKAAKEREAAEGEKADQP